MRLVLLDFPLNSEVLVKNPTKQKGERRDFLNLMAPPFTMSNETTCLRKCSVFQLHGTGENGTQILDQFGVSGICL